MWTFVVFGLTSLICFATTIYGGIRFDKYRRKKALYHEYMHTDLEGAPLSFTDAPVATSDLSPGDHIYVAIGGIKSTVTSSSRVLSAVGYHHGIFLGSINGERRVADFGRENKTHPVTTSLYEFMYENMTTQLYIRRYTSGYILPMKNILEQAAKMEGCMEWGCYDLVDNNCEHFATFLKTGKPWSVQANVVI